MKKLFWLSIFLVCGGYGIAQQAYQVGWLPSINLSKKLNNDWKFNAKVEFRQTFQEGVFGENTNWEYDYKFTDITLVTSRRIGVNNSISGGYVMRLSDDEVIHRFLQQYALVQRMDGWRLAHRIRLDETFIPNRDMIWRLRYRISSEIPLNGQSIDNQEFYLKINQESLGILQAEDFDLEIRLIPIIGLLISDKNRIESGLDYRLNSFLNDDAQHRFWWNLSWYINL